MKLSNLTFTGVLLLILMANMGGITANQFGSLPTGEFRINDSYIIQKEGDYSFYFQQNEHTIGEDTSRYEHNFNVLLEINVTEINNFFIIFKFSTPFDTLMGGSPSFANLGSPPQEINFTTPSLSDNSVFQYTFIPIDTTSFVGNIMIDMTLDTTGEMHDVRGTETFGIELINGTIYSEEVIEFQMPLIEYSTTLGPDNRFIPIDYFSILFSLIIIPIIRRVRRS